MIYKNIMSRMEVSLMSQLFLELVQMMDEVRAGFK